MKLLVACEESQRVCIAFRNLGHDAYSCDIQECSGGHPEWHIQGDAIAEAYSGKYDIMIAHPPCTYLSYAATSSWNNEGRLQKRLDALDFFAKLWLAPIDKICIENPMGCASPTIAKYSQVIQPYYFGDAESKRTCLWLKNLPNLAYSQGDTLFEKNTVTKPKIYAYYKNGKNKGKPIYGNNYLQFASDRGKKRSVTFQGIAEAMASQWGVL
jgi:hypothetical protein